MRFAPLIVLLVFCLPTMAAAGEFARLTIETAGAPYVFEVEVADTPEAQQRGLMYRYDMPDNEGMLFDFRTREAPVSMWMKNTYMPLDMVFISDDYRVLGWHENATPLSLDMIDAPEGTVYVLEINAGLAATMGVVEGDRVSLTFND